jgi:hypothetical protein
MDGRRRTRRSLSGEQRPALINADVANPLLSHLRTRSGQPRQSLPARRAELDRSGSSSHNAKRLHCNRLADLVQESAMGIDDIVEIVHARIA